MFTALIAALNLGSMTLPAQPQVIDAMPPLFNLYARPLSTAARVRLFREDVLTKYHDAYDDNQRNITDAALAHYLDLTSRYVPTMKAIDKSMRSDVPSVIHRFKLAFPDFDTSFRIVLMPSLDYFDGTVRDVGNEPGVLFGLDQLAAMSSTSREKLSVVATHEFVHLYQGERNADFQSVLNADSPPIWATLWSEGLATYA